MQNRYEINAQQFAMLALDHKRLMAVFETLSDNRLSVAPCLTAQLYGIHFAANRLRPFGGNMQVLYAPHTP